MTHLDQLDQLKSDQLEIAFEEGAVRFQGVISMRSPDESLGPFLRAIHRAAVNDGIEELPIDIRLLRFMNSSSIRLLIDWLEWINKEPTDRRYVLKFLTSSSATWQQTTLSAIEALNPEHVKVIRAL